MILVIAEKPSLKEDIVSALAAMLKKPVARSGSGYSDIGEYRVTSALGHLLTLKMPEDYDAKYADRSDMSLLPIYFPHWEMKIRQRKEKGDKSIEERVALIGQLLRQADMVIHAGDPDDEGQLLIDEILRWHNYAGPVRRLDTGNTTQEALVKALRNLQDNKKWEPYGEAAYARSVADLMVGTTMSRYFSAMNGTSLPVGRVKCPTLWLVVTRDRQRAEHKETVYYKVRALVRLSSGAVIETEYVPSKEDPRLTDGMILNRKYAERIARCLDGVRVTATIVKSPVISKPPLPFNLVKLQDFCSSKFGYTPTEVVKITQSLREKHKAITYNRTDCQYLSDEHFEEAPKTTAATLQSLGITIPTLDVSIKSRCFNSKKITTHFAIIPSGKVVDLNSMTAPERNVYTAIAHYYLAQFLPNAKKERTVLEAPLDSDDMLRATSTEIKSPGYIALLGNPDQTDEPVSALSAVPEGEYASIVDSAEVKECETKPKPAYTPATLIVDMTRIAEFCDPETRALLLKKDAGDDSAHGSIGTEATRHVIIDDLLRQGYCEMNGKHIVSTPLGKAFCGILPEELTTPTLTARWWVIQESIKTGEKAHEDLENDVLSTIEYLLTKDYPKLGTLQAVTEYRNKVGVCPRCGGDVVVGKRAFGCVNFKNGCKFAIWMESDRGLLSRTTITPTMARSLLAGKDVFVTSLWSEEKKKLFPGKLSLDKDPNAPYPVKITLEREPLGQCPACKTGTIIEGKYGYGCSNYKTCNFVIHKTGKEGTMFSACKITKSMVKQLLKGNTIKGVTLLSQDGKEYKGDIAIQKNESGQYWLSRVKTEYGQVVGVCPRCGGIVKETPRTFACENNNKDGTGCKFVIWKLAQKGLMRNAEITAEMAQRLILGEKVKCSKLALSESTIERNKAEGKKGKKTFSGTIHLDDSERSDYGPRIVLDSTK